ncbi:hypothetical protein B0H14DRAFT_3058238 [Mycena olivaceomarginata]|nr:hypothetical protein B0H14DRAFT_3058238 [Mycena olivaceomarginata]
MRGRCSPSLTILAAHLAVHALAVHIVLDVPYTDHWYTLSCSPALHCRRRMTRFPASTSSCGPPLNAFSIYIITFMHGRMACSACHVLIPRERRHEKAPIIWGYLVCQEPDPTYTCCAPTVHAEANRMSPDVFGVEGRAGKREAQIQLRVWQAYLGACWHSSSAPSVHVANAMPCI